MLKRALLAVFLLQLSLWAGDKPAQVTFSKDVLPVLQKNCQECHRPGEAAPMSLLTYKDARPWAKAIRESILARRMPPWFADPAYGKFHNQRVLSQKDIDTLVAWADGGAIEGNPDNAPQPVEWIEGWTIGKPDLVVQMPKPYHVPPEGTIEYTYVVLPLNLKEDSWVQAAEVRPGARSVVHHVIAFLREPQSKWMRGVEYGVPFVPKKAEPSSNNKRDESAQAGGPGSELLVGYAPGLQSQHWQPGQAKLVKAGTDVVFQLHYTADGKAATDQTKIGIVFAKEPVKERVMTVPAVNGKFVIPPGDSNYEVHSQFTVQADARLIGLMPHMHLRGKDFEYQAVYPTGERETLLRVPRYDFNWQLFYWLEQPKVFPKGTRLECTAHFDNSANNAANPDPTKEVRWGDQSWEEMMIGWFDIAFDPGMDPVKLFRPEKKPASGTSGGE